ncbi:hypothetical protein [Aeromonas veronii]|uniref:hypothetical protein n=1 Tax=Aeromonas veronii TaxID=654 RepID=UPI0032EC7F34
MKSWIKVGLAGCLVLVAGLWGGSVRAAEMPLGTDGIALPGQIVTRAALPMDTYVQTLENLLSVAAGRSTPGRE